MHHNRRSRSPFARPRSNSRATPIGLSNCYTEPHAIPLPKPLMRPLEWFKSGLSEWRGYIPLVPILMDYKREDFSHDLIAGLVVGMVTIPQAVAYAFLAGVPPEAGLYACLVPMVLYAILGSLRQLVVGPVAVAALMVSDSVGCLPVDMFPGWGG